MFYEFLPNLFIVSLNTYNLLEWQTSPQIQRSINDKLIVNLTVNSNLSVNESTFTKSKIQIFNSNHEQHFNFIINEYLNKNIVLIVIFDKKSFIKRFINFFIKKFANGDQYINDVDEIISMNTGTLFSVQDIES